MNPWVIIAEIGITVGLWALNKYLTNIPDTRAKFLADAPLATEGSPVNILIGRRRITNPTFMWYGGFRDRGPIDWGGISEPDGTTHYGINMLINLGIPMGTSADWATHCQFWGLYVGDKYLYCPLTDGQGQKLSSLGGTLPPDQLYTGALNLTGFVQFFGGGVTQSISNNAASAPSDFATFTDLTEIAWFMRRARLTSGQPDPTTIPGYRGQMLIALSGKHDFLTFDQNAGSGDFWDAFFMGQDPHIPQLSFEVSSYRNRYNSGWTTNLDADPASAMYDLLTQDWGKFNIDASNVDDASFGAASSTLLSEGIGYSRVIDTLRDGKEILQEMVNHVCGTVYQDPLTRTVHIKLIRGDYDAVTPGAILSLTAPDVISIDECTVGNWRNVVNQVRVKYYDRKLMYGEAIAVSQNMASAIMQDTVFGDISVPGSNVRSVTVEYPGCCTYATANKLAARDLRLLSQPLQQLRASFTRKAAVLRPGDVFKLTFPDYPALATPVVFRVTSVDLGQPGAGQVQVVAVQDVFSIGSTTAYAPPKWEIFIPQASPITVRKVTEQPRWILQFLQGTGAIHDADRQRLLTAGTPDDGAAQYQSQSLPLIYAILGGAFSVDMGLTSNALHAYVHTAYDRSAGPYDLTTGLVIDSLPGGAAALLPTQTWSPSSIRSMGYNLILVGDEVMAYESCTGTGPWTLHNVWRGLLDTPARDHAVGEDIFWIGTAFAIGEYCGHNSFADNVGPISVQLNGRLGILTGSGEDPIDSITPRGRHGLPCRVANPRLCGEVASGVALQPAVSPPAGLSGMFGKTTATEEGVGFDFTIRSRTASTVVRGDDAAEVASEAQTYEISGRKVNATQEDPQPGDTTLLTALSAGDLANNLLMGQVGYGDVDVSFRSRNTATSATEWDTPKVRTRWERWRNLLGNTRWIVHGAGTNVAPCWTSAAGGTVVASASSIYLTASGTYITTVVNGQSIVQVVDVTGFLPRGMDAWVEYYARSITTLDRVNCKIEALDNSLSVLGTTNANFSAPTGNWQAVQLSLGSMPASTVKVRVTFTFGGLGTSPTAYVCEPRLRIGVFQRSDLTLTNPGFESALTGWTTVTGGFTTDTVGKSPSANYARGGAFAASEIEQELTLGSGLEVGSDAVLTIWRSQSINNDTGEVMMEARDALNNVLVTTTTGAENLTTGQWTQRRLSIQCPDGTAKVRVRLLAVRSGGAGNSGAMFDDVMLSVHKDQSDARYYRKLLFSNNSQQSIAATWQEWHVDHAALYRAGVPNPIAFGNGSASMNGITSRPVQMRWSDLVAHANGVGVGIWGGSLIGGEFPTPSVNTFSFARGGVDFESFNEDGSFRHLSPASADPFTFIVLFKVDEENFSTACGLAGRRGGGRGWGLTITAGGFVSAILEGSGGAVAATCALTPVADGAWHYAAIIVDPVGNTVTVKTEYEAVSVSTASIGEISNVDNASPFRLGRSSVGDDTLPGMIAFGYWFDYTLSGAQVSAHWNYGEDPTGALTSYTCPGPSWIPGARDSAGSETCVLVAADQVGVAYVRGSFDDLGMALATGASTTNRCHSFDFTNGSYWNADAGIALTQGIVDATGRTKGVTVPSTVTNGITLAWCDVTQPTISITFWAKATAAGSIAIEVRDSLGALKSTTFVGLTTLWKRYVVLLPSWDAATPTATLRFRGALGSVTFSLSSVMHVDDGPNAPALIPRYAGTAIGGDTFATLLETLPDQFNAEGEIIIDASTPTSSPVANWSLVTVDNAVNNGNAREFRLGLGTLPTFVHSDSAGFPASSGTSALDPSQGFSLRGRWCSLATLDNAANPYAGIVTTGSVSGSNYGRSAPWTYDTTNDQRIRIGVGTRTSFQGYVHRFVARAREEKLI